MSQCPHCKTDNPLGSSNCRGCGSRLTSWGTMIQPQPMLGPRPVVTVRVVRADGGPEAAFAVNRDTVTVGSAGEILLVDDPFVAAAQARLFFHGPAFMVEDVGGGNGVFTRIRTEHTLEPGEELRCGRQRLVLEELPPPCDPPAWGSPEDGCRVRFVQLLEGGRRGDGFPLHEGDNLLGRDAGDLSFPGDGFVSGRHAVLTVTGNRVLVRDVGSSNGTFRRLPVPASLENGDQLLIGRHLLKLELRAAAS